MKIDFFIKNIYIMNFLLDNQRLIDYIKVDLGYRFIL